MDTLDTGTQISLETAGTGSQADELLLVPVAPAQGLPAGLQDQELVLVETAVGERHLLLPICQLGDNTAEAFRRAGGRAGRWMLGYGAASARLKCEDSLFGASDGEALEAFSEGLLLGSFRFNRYKSARQEGKPVRIYLAAGEGCAPVEEVIRRSTALASGVNLARWISEEPPNVINPLSLAERAAALAAQDHLKCRVLGESELADMGAGGIIAVGLGSQTPSQLIVLEYTGRGAGVGRPPVVLVGKALTFDSGGYMLKERAAITSMKYDKCGGAAVLGVLHSAAQLGLETPVVGLIAAAENMISADAYRPGDILHTLSGKTVEINNTDAEGRLVLADTLTYAGKFYQPRCLVDIATLTYGVVTALGRRRAGLLSNEDALAQELIASGEHTSERLWRLPLGEEYLPLIQSDVADIKNYSGTSDASPITAGLFLQQFAPEGVPWAHLDILGTATTETDLPYSPKGATGFGVRLLIDFISRQGTSDSS